MRNIILKTFFAAQAEGNATVMVACKRLLNHHGRESDLMVVRYFAEDHFAEGMGS